MYYGSTDYINYDDFNNIEFRLESLTYSVAYFSPEIPLYDFDTRWKANDWCFLEKVKKIEDGIENLKKYFTRPENWLPSKDWVPMSSFSYVDINRWLNNMNAIESILNNNYTIWNGRTHVNWEENSIYEWEEY